jgi:hypothetical protein
MNFRNPKNAKEKNPGQCQIEILTFDIMTDISDGNKSEKEA